MRAHLHFRTFAFVVAATLSAAMASAQTTPPPAGALRPYVFPSVEQFQLANGLKVILVQKHTLPVVEGRLILDAGAMREPAAKNGLASLTGSLLSEGTGTMTGAEIARAMDALGAQYFTGAGFSTATADVVALKNVFPQALALAAKNRHRAELSRRRGFTRKEPGSCRLSAESRTDRRTRIRRVHTRCVRHCSAVLAARQRHSGHDWCADARRCSQLAPYDVRAVRGDAPSGG